MDRQARAYAYAALTVLLWSTVASAFKLTLKHLNAVEMLLYASLTSLIVLGTILAGQKKLHLLRRCTPRDCLRSLCLGFLNPFLYYMILFRAYDLLPAQEAQPLNYTWAIMLVILSAFILRQPVKPIQVAAILISFIGVFIISTRGDVLGFRFTNLTGAMLALSSSLIWALFWLFNVRDKRDEGIKLFLNFLGGFFLTLVFVLLFTDLRKPAWPGLLGAAYIGLFEMGITFFLWLKALSLSRTAAQVANLVYASPFLSLILIHFLVGEKILASSILGLLFIITGVVLQESFSAASKTS